MKKEHFVFLDAIGSGLMATILVFNFLKSAHQVQGRFVIAHTAILKGQVVQEQDVGLSKILKTSDTKNLFVEVSDVVGQKALHDIATGSLIYRSKVARENTQPGPQKKALPIPKDMRSLTLSRDDITNVPDLLDIGSYVDIIGQTTGVNGEKEMRTIVSSRQVISVSPLDGSPIESITVAVMPNEAESALEAASLKRLQLLVRQDRAADQQRMFEPSAGSIEIIRGVQKEGVFRR